MNKDSETLVNRILVELGHSDRGFFDSLSVRDKALALSLLDEMRGGARSPLLNQLWEMDYVRRPVDVHTFLTSKDYLGMDIIRTAEDEARTSGVFEVWADTLIELFRPDRSYWELILSSSIGTGKCLRHNALLHTNLGLVKAERAYSDANVTDILSESGMRKITHKHNEGVTQTKKITTKHGHEIEVRPNHRLRVLSGLTKVWKEAKDLTPGDVLLEQPATHSGSTLNPAYAELIGWTIAEGDFSRNKQLHLCVATDEVGYICSLINDAGLQVHLVRNDSRSKAANVIFYDDTMRAMFSQDTRSASVKIPDHILGHDTPTLCRVLRGLFSGDGSIDCRGCIEYCSISKELAHQIRVLLTSLGIECSISECDATYTIDGKMTYVGRRHRIHICGYQARVKFEKLIGFSEGRKAEKLAEVLAKGCNQNSDHTFSIKLSDDDARALRAMQPKGLDSAAKSPRGLTHRLVGTKNKQGQRCTVSLLRAIRDTGGVLTDDLHAIADGRLLFDEVDTVIDSQEHCYDFTVEGDPSYIADGFIHHNTSAAVLAMVYKLYRMSCLKNPQKFYGLLPGHGIVFGVYNIFKYKAQSVAVSYFREALEGCKYFRDIFPLNPRKTVEIEFPNSIKVSYGSSALSAIGENIFSVLIDETEFMKAGASDDDKGQAWNLYNSTLRRMESRYMRGGEIPGLMCQISSKASVDSYLSERIKSRGEARDVLVVEKTSWDVKPWRYSGKTFPVFVGDNRSDPRVMDEMEADATQDKTHIIQVPVEHRTPFIEDIHGALRDLANVASGSIAPLIPIRERIYESVDPTRKHPFTKLEFHIGLEDDTAIEDYLIHDALLNTVKSRFVPKVNPTVGRYIHFDLAVSGDALGFCMGHVSGFDITKKEDPNIPGHWHEFKTPKIYIDILLRIIPIKGSKIRLSAVRDFIFALQGYGFPIAKVSGDTYQSTDILQQLLRSGIKAEVLSVDVAREKDGHPYANFREAIMEGRVSYYHYPILLAEAANLQRLDIVQGGKIKWKVDHPAKMNDMDGNPIKGCFSGDTRISLLSGKETTLAWLAENSPEESFHVYTMRDGRVSVGVARHPRLTQKNATTVVVTLDNGEEITCTPDHRFMLRSGDYKEAGSLVVGESLMPLYRKITSKSANKDKLLGYELFRCPGDGKWHLTHRMVGKWKYGSAYDNGSGTNGMVIHHSAGKLNNDPDRLMLMNNVEHGIAHAEDIKRKRADPVFEAKRLGNFLAYCKSDEGRQKSRENMQGLHTREDFANAIKERARVMGKRTGKVNLTKYNKSDAHRRVASEIGKRTIWAAIAASKMTPRARGSANHQARKDITLDVIIQLAKDNKWKQVHALRAANCTQKVFTRILKEHGFNVWQDFVDHYIADPKTLELIRVTSDKVRLDGGRVIPLDVLQPLILAGSTMANSGYTRIIWCDSMRYHKAHNAEFSATFSNYCGQRIAKRMKNNKYMQKFRNHSVVSVRPGPCVDVYDISVDGTQNFALSAGVFVHNSKDVADSLCGVIRQCMLQEPDVDPAPVSPVQALISSVPTQLARPRFMQNDDWAVGTDYRP